MKKIIIAIVAILCIGVGFALLITKTVKFPSKEQPTDPIEAVTTTAAADVDATALTDESGSTVEGQSEAENGSDKDGETTKKDRTTKKSETTKKERTTKPVTTRSPDATTRKGAYHYAQSPGDLTSTTLADTSTFFTVPTTAALSAKDHPYTFASEADFNRNFASYGSDFGDITPDQYLTYANSLILSTTPYVEKKYAGNITHFYNPPTGEYASVSDDGHIIMYNRPKDPDKFWANIGS